MHIIFKIKSSQNKRWKIDDKDISFNQKVMSFEFFEFLGFW